MKIIPHIDLLTKCEKIDVYSSMINEWNDLSQIFFLLRSLQRRTISRRQLLLPLIFSLITISLLPHGCHLTLPGQAREGGADVLREVAEAEVSGKVGVDDVVVAQEIQLCWKRVIILPELPLPADHTNQSQLNLEQT